MEELSKQEAAEYLGVSLRTLERYIKKNLIAVKYVKSGTGRKAVFFKSELDELKTQLDTESFKPTVEEEKQEETAIITTQETPNFLALQKSIIETVISEFDRYSSQVRISEKILLNLKEAQKLTGLSREVLRQAIKEEKLKAKMIGNSWKIKRADLDSFIENL